MQDEISPSTSGPTLTKTPKANGKWKASAQGTDSTATADSSTDQSQFLDTAKKAYDNVVEKAAGAFQDFDASPVTYIRQYPIQAAVGGLVVGMLLGAAISRRSVTK